MPIFIYFCVGKCANVGEMSEDGIRCLHLLPTLPSHLKQALSLSQRLVLSQLGWKPGRPCDSLVARTPGMLYMCWHPNSGIVIVDQTFLTIELSLQPLLLCI